MSLVKKNIGARKRGKVHNKPFNLAIIRNVEVVLSLRPSLAPLSSSFLKKFRIFRAAMPRTCLFSPHMHTIKVLLQSIDDEQT